MFMAHRLSSGRLFQRDNLLIGRFNAMGSSCEILMETSDMAVAQSILKTAADEAYRIQDKFSRYNSSSVVQKMNQSQGQPILVDEETAHLLDFADRCYHLSQGLFDVTSGILRKAWTFDGRSHLPPTEEIQRLLPFVGWSKVIWKKPSFQMQPGMEIDLGGIGKEYAVDRCRQLIEPLATFGVLINFGGDLAVVGTRHDHQPWTVGIEHADQEDVARRTLQIKSGALATSGDSKKFILVDGKRYGHILNPLNGWPVSEAPRSVTVGATTCTEAGFLSTFGILNGQNADSVLQSVGVPHWCY